MSLSFGQCIARAYPLVRGRFRLLKLLRWVESPGGEVDCTSLGRIQLIPNQTPSDYLYYYGEWEPDTTNVVRSVLDVGSVFIDVGANIGYFTVVAASEVGDSGRVIAIEAGSLAYGVLSDNVRSLAGSNAETVRAAVTSNDGVQVLLLADNGARNRVVSEEGEGDGRVERIRGVTLDTLAEEQGLVSCDCIKIDVEGHELHVLQGARNVLKSYRPVVILEAVLGHTERAMVKEALGILIGLGYTLEGVRGQQIEGLEDLDRRFPNIVAKPM